MYFRVLGFVLTCFMQALGAYADEMPPQSGVIAMASEPVSVKTTPIKGKIIGRTASTGQAVYLNDEIKTSATAKAQILLKDQSVFSIGPNSTMVIDKFVYDPQKSSLNVSIQKGAFKFVSGKIANSSDEAMKVSLPNATIAVRGTGVAGIVESNGSATVMLLHGAVDVTSLVNNSTSTLSKSGWGVQINPAGVVSPPAPLPADISRNIMQTSKTNQAVPVASSIASSSASSSTSSVANTNTNSSSNISSSSTVSTSNTIANTATLTAPEVTSAVTSSNSPTGNSGALVATNSVVTPASTTTTLASSASGSFSTTAATTNLATGNSQLAVANTYLATAQTQASNALSQASSAATQATSAASQASTAATQATAAANPPFTAPELAIRANELAAIAASAASSASTAASSYSTQASTSATSTAQASTASNQAATSAITYASTAAQQANSVVSAATTSQDAKTAAGLVTQANTLNTQANTTNTAATLANTQAASAATAAQTSASQALNSSLAAASSALSAYNSAQNVVQTQNLPAYETISSSTTGLGPLGNVTFSISNYAMSCWSNCAGASATINSHTFVFNFLNSTVTNNYNISFNSFNGYTGTVSGSNAATAINWSSPTVVSLPVSGQTSTVGSNVYAMMDTVLTSVGASGLTKRANVATVYTSLFSGGTNGVGATSQMGVGSGYKILGK
jgi:hypothetical protein